MAVLLPRSFGDHGVLSAPFCRLLVLDEQPFVLLTNPAEEEKTVIRPRGWSPRDLSIVAKTGHQLIEVRCRNLLPTTRGVLGPALNNEHPVQPPKFGCEFVHWTWETESPRQNWIAV